jgi:hypothetical protein
MWICTYCDNINTSDIIRSPNGYKTTTRCLRCNAAYYHRVDPIFYIFEIKQGVCHGCGAINQKLYGDHYHEHCVYCNYDYGSENSKARKTSCGDPKSFRGFLCPSCNCKDNVLEGVPNIIKEKYANARPLDRKKGGITPDEHVGDLFVRIITGKD